MAFPSSIVPDYANNVWVVSFARTPNFDSSSGPWDGSSMWYRVWIAGIEYTSSLNLVGSDGVFSQQGPTGPNEKYLGSTISGITSFTIPLDNFKIPNLGITYGASLAISGVIGNAVFTSETWTPESLISVDSLVYNGSSKQFEVTLSDETTDPVIFPFTVIDRTPITGPYFIFSDGITENRLAKTITVPAGISFFSFRITDVSLIARTFVISLANETITTTIDADFTEEITVDPPPGQATQGATANPFDYSDHLDRIVTALERLVITQRSSAVSLNSLSVISADISSELNTLNSNINLNNQISNSIAGIQTGIASSNSSIASNQTSIAASQNAIQEHQRIIKELAEGTGIHTISPLEFVNFIYTYRTLIEEGAFMRWRDKLPSDKEISKSLNDLGKYLDKIRNNIPKAF